MYKDRTLSRLRHKFHFCNVSVTRVQAMLPAAKDAQNARIVLVYGNAPKYTSAGPGHNPSRPQPTPKSVAPATSLASISVLVGSEWKFASTGLTPWMIGLNPAIATGSAPTKTKSSVGSHAPDLRSRKPTVLEGMTMPDTMSPPPKHMPRTY